MVEPKKISLEQKKLDRLQEFSWSDLNLSSKRADITIEKVDGLPEEYHYKCQVAVQEALMQEKSDLYEYADAVVKRLIAETEEAHWLCQIYPAEVDVGLSYFRKGSILLSFGPSDKKYEVRIACLY